LHAARQKEKWSRIPDDDIGFRRDARAPKSKG
jgi:hypothetical protein